jgi:hypothetical protein
VDSSINGSEPVSDIDPALRADPAATYDKVASAYAATFLHELDHKPFDREILTRFAAATRRGSRGATPSATSDAVRDKSVPSWPPTVSTRWE